MYFHVCYIFLLYFVDLYIKSLKYLQNIVNLVIQVVKKYEYINYIYFSIYFFNCVIFIKQKKRI